MNNCITVLSYTIPTPSMHLQYLTTIPTPRDVTQNMPLSPYTHTLILVKLMTSPGSATRYTTHDIPLHHRVLMYCSNATTISSQHLPPNTHIHYTTHSHPQPLKTFDLLIPPRLIPHTIYHCITMLLYTVVSLPPIHSRNMPSKHMHLTHIARSHSHPHTLAHYTLH